MFTTIEKAKDIFYSLYRFPSVRRDIEDLSVSSIDIGKNFEILISNGVDWHVDYYFGIKHTYIYTIQNPENNYHLEVSRSDDTIEKPPLSVRKFKMEEDSTIKLNIMRLHSLFSKKEFNFESEGDEKILWIGFGYNTNEKTTCSQAESKIKEFIENKWDEINYGKNQNGQ